MIGILFTGDPGNKQNNMVTNQSQIEAWTYMYMVVWYACVWIWVFKYMAVLQGEKRPSSYVI